MKSLFAISRTTILEGLQQPVLWLLTLVGVEFIALQPLLQLHTFGDSARLSRDCSAAILLLFSVFNGILTARESVANEIHKGVASLVLSKPIARGIYLFGKWLGICVVVSVSVWCFVWASMFASRTAEAFVQTATWTGDTRDTLCGLLSLALPLLSLAIAAVLNAFRGRRLGLCFMGSMSLLYPLAAVFLGFWTRAGEWVGFAEFAFQLDFRLFPGFLPIFFLACIFIAFAILFMTRFQAGAAAVLTFIMLFLGFLADHLASTGLLGKALYIFLPDVQNFWLTDALATGAGVSLVTLALTVLQSLLYSFALLLLASVSFRHVDL